jgi:multisubunit Na+/H+ antiporter MnhG subunit
MLIEPKTNKMKTVGYMCIIYAAVISTLSLFPAIGIGNINEVLPLMNTWLTTGVSLLTVNAAKRAIGAKLQKEER